MMSPLCSIRVEQGLRDPSVCGEKNTASYRCSEKERCKSCLAYVYASGCAPQESEDLIAVVLAGGEGTRMRPLTFTRPKPMLPVGPLPSIHFLVQHLSDQGFKDIIIVVGYLKDQIMGYVGNGERFGARVSYAVEPEGTVFGTAGSLKLAAHLLNETFLVAQGDTISEIPLSSMFGFHRRAGRDLTIALTRVERPSEYGVAVVDEKNQINQFQEKPPPDEAKSNLASAGFYVLEPEITDYISNDRWDFAKDLFPSLMSLGMTITGYITDSFWADIGSLAGYLKAIRWALDGSRGLAPHDNWRALGSAMVAEGTVISERCRIEGPSLIEAGVRIGDCVRISAYSVVKSNSLLSEGCSIENSVLLEGTTLGRSAHVLFSAVGERASIGDGTEISSSIIGPGSSLGSGCKVSEGSRVWPNIAIKPGDLVSGLVAVPRDKPFYFYSSLGNYTGFLATSIDEFIEGLKDVPVPSLEFHIFRRDFERWATDAIGSLVLSERIRDIRRKGLLGEDLREGLLECTNRWKREALVNEGTPP